MNLDLRDAKFRPFCHQAAFLRSTARFRGAFSGNRGGKTACGAYEFVSRVFRDIAANAGKPRIGHGQDGLHKRLYWIVAPDYRLGQVSYGMVKRLLPPAAIVDENKSTHSMLLVGGSKIELRSAEDPRRLVAESLNGLWVDEAPRVKAEAWRGALRARLADQQGWGLFTGSPLGGRDNWVYQDLVAANGQDGIETFTWTTADNPYIPRSEVRWAEEHLPRSHFLRDWQASWDSSGGAIYEEFKPETHVLTENELRMQYAHALRGRDFKTLFRRVVAGVDWGWQAPGCMLVIGQIGEDEFVVLEESYAAGRSVLRGAGTTWLSEAKRLRDKWGVSLFAADPAYPRDISDLANNGIPIVGANNDVSHGIRRVAEAMHPVNGRPGLRVLSSCTNLIREIRNYLWQSNREQTGFLDEPAKGASDHALDTLRYGLLELNPVSIVDRFRHYTGGAARPIG